MSGSDIDQLDQFQRLIMVAGALTGDIEPEQIVEIVASQGMAGTHASGAGLYLLDGDIVHLATAVGSTRASIRTVIGRGVGRLDTPLSRPPARWDHFRGVAPARWDRGCAR